MLYFCVPKCDHQTHELLVLGFVLEERITSLYFTSDFSIHFSLEEFIERYPLVLCLLSVRYFHTKLFILC
jgi:hypothetical protein